MQTYFPSKVGAFIFFSWVAALATSSLVSLHPSVRS